jgi:hypothetical protein
VQESALANVLGQTCFTALSEYLKQVPLVVCSECFEESSNGRFRDEFWFENRRRPKAQSVSNLDDAMEHDLLFSYVRD